MDFIPADIQIGQDQIRICGPISGHLIILVRLNGIINKRLRSNFIKRVYLFGLFVFQIVREKLETGQTDFSGIIFPIRNHADRAGISFLISADCLRKLRRNLSILVFGELA